MFNGRQPHTAVLSSVRSRGTIWSMKTPRRYTTDSTGTIDSIGRRGKLLLPLFDGQQPVESEGACTICSTHSILGDGLCVTCWDKRIDEEE